MYSVHLTGKFKKDYKRCLKRGMPEKEIKAVMLLLAQRQRLPKKYRENYLKGDYKNHHECHIRPDWLLIWRVFENENEIAFIRTESHSELFD